MASLADVVKIVKKPLYAAGIRASDEAEPEQDYRLTVPRKFKYGKEA